MVERQFAGTRREIVDEANHQTWPNELDGERWTVHGLSDVKQCIWPVTVYCRSQTIKLFIGQDVIVHAVNKYFFAFRQILQQLPL